MEKLFLYIFNQKLIIFLNIEMQDNQPFLIRSIEILHFLTVIVFDQPFLEQEVFLLRN